MSKKIKITESQYNRLVQLMVETPFDTMAKDSIKAGDIISITWKGTKNNFKVINNTSGQVVMDNIDKGSTNINYRYFMVYTSLNGDDLQMRRVHKIKEADKLNDSKTWSPITVKDITNIEVIRDGKVVDKVDPLSPSAEKQQKKGGAEDEKVTDDFIQDINNNLSIILEQLNENKGLKLFMNNATIVFCCNGRNGNVFNLEISENKSIPSLDKWDSYILEIKGNPNDDDESSLYEANKDIVKVTDGGKTFGLKFQVQSGEKKSQVWVLNNEGLSVTKSCTDFEEEEGAKEDEAKSDDELKRDARELYNDILADKNMQKAFYSQPTFWQAFMSELRGKKHPGTGIITVMKIVKKYKDKKLAEQIGEGFGKKGDIVKFTPLKPIEIDYNTKKGERRTFTIQTVNPTDVRIAEDKKETGLVLQVNLPNDAEHTLRIVVLGKTETEDIKECRITIGRISPNNNYYTVLSNSIPANLKFLKSDGYNPPKQENTK